jgi:hypothetical protein
MARQAPAAPLSTQSSRRFAARCIAHRVTRHEAATRQFAVVLAVVGGTAWAADAVVATATTRARRPALRPVPAT